MLRAFPCRDFLFRRHVVTILNVRVKKLAYLMLLL